MNEANGSNFGAGSNHGQCSKLPNTRITLHTRSNSGVHASRSNRLSTEVREETGDRASESAAASKRIKLAYMAKISRTSLVGCGVGGGENAASGASKERRDDILEDVPFGDDVAAACDIEGVAAISVPVVVDCVDEGVAPDFG